MANRGRVSGHGSYKCALVPRGETKFPERRCEILGSWTGGPDRSVNERGRVWPMALVGPDAEVIQILGSELAWWGADLRSIDLGECLGRRGRD